MEDTLLALINQLPEDLQEEDTTGRDLIDKIIEESRRLGIREGIGMYAWWKDGTQFVGTTGRTLREALSEFNVP